MSTELVWPSLCLAIGLTLLIAEVFIPSGGLIGLLAVGFLAVSLWLAFTNTAHGFKFLLAELVLLPLAVTLAIHLWPKTPVGKYMFLSPPEGEELAREVRGIGLDHLIGSFGRALTPLRPSGMVDFEGRRIDGLSEAGLIPAGSLVRAVQVRGSQLVVRTADDRTIEELIS